MCCYRAKGREGIGRIGRRVATKTHRRQNAKCTGIVSCAALQDVKRVLATARADLNITTASGKGRVAGCLQLLQPKAGHWLDCSGSVFAVPGDVHDIQCATSYNERI